MADRLLLSDGSLLLLANGVDHLLLADQTTFVPDDPDATPNRRAYTTDHRRTYVTDHRATYRTDHRRTYPT